MHLAIYVSPFVNFTWVLSKEVTTDHTIWSASLGQFHSSGDPTATCRRFGWWRRTRHLCHVPSSSPTAQDSARPTRAHPSSISLENNVRSQCSAVQSQL